MSRANALLTPRARLRLARLVVESGLSYAAAAKMFMVSLRTAARWPTATASRGQPGWPTVLRGRTRHQGT